MASPGFVGVDPTAARELAARTARWGRAAMTERKLVEPNTDGVALVGALAWAIPALMPLLDEHLRDMDQEVLPHLLMGAYVQAIPTLLKNDVESVKRLFDMLEEAATHAQGELRNVLAMSFLEDLSTDLLHLVGPNLQDLGETERVLGHR